jgi:hypothetical protein
MKHFTKVLSVLGGCLLALSPQAQVSFTNSSSIIGTITGSGYEDCAVDMNGDHLDDIVRVVGSGIYIDYQQMDGTFDQTFFPLSIENPPSWSICAADIDENGYTDLLFGNGSRVSFAYANDDGTAYTEVTYPEYIFSQRSTFSDINNDGAIDAFVCHDVDQSHPYFNVDGVMVLDQAQFPTLDVGGNYANIWCDYDNDWDQDLYITKCRGGAPEGDLQRINLLYRNNGDGTFTNVAQEAGMDDGDQSWTTCFEDFDNDGDFDAFTVNHAWANRLMENNGDGTFTDIITGSGIDAGDLGAWNCDAGDFDNNGFVDIFSQMGTELYLNNGDGTFSAVQLSFNDGGIGDFNDDGFLDVIKNNTLWLNDGNDNNWLKVGLEGIISNKDGIGARIEIYGEWGIQIREIRSGESFSPMSSLDEHFGLGTATEISSIVVKWPSGVTTLIENPDINSTIIIPESSCTSPDNTIIVDGITSICPGETIELTAEAGTSYNWSNGATTQTIEVGAQGNYSVVIWDEEGCASLSNSVIVNILEDETPMISLEGDDVFCEGGTAILTSTIGENYNWSNGDDAQTIVVNQSGEYSVMIDAICSVEQLESQTITITVLDAADLPVSANVLLDTPGIATLTATGENLVWYDAEDAIDPIGSGDSFETPVVNVGAPLTYWVEASTIYGGGEEAGGKADNEGSGGLPSSGGVLFFDAFEAFTLLEVTVYVPEGSPTTDRTIQLYDQNGTVIGEHVEAFDIGTHQVALNFEVPMGNGLSIGCVENDLFRNSAGVSYPYEIGTVGTIYDSTFGTSYYYYFYDWQIQKEQMICPSARVEVMASVVGVEELDIFSSLSIFPNPASDKVTVSLELIQGSKVTLRMMDVSGALVLSQDWGQVTGFQNRNIDTHNLASGVYSVAITVGESVANSSLVIE